MKKFIFIFIIFTACGTFEKEIEIPRDEIQEMVDAKFPYDKNVILARLTLESPNIYFVEKNVGMKLNYSGKFIEKEINGTINFNGQIYYKPEKGAFYLNEFNIVEIIVDDANFSQKENLQKTVTQIIDNYLDDYPVYTLKPENFKQKLAKLFLKDVFVRNENLVVVIGN